MCVARPATRLLVHVGNLRRLHKLRRNVERRQELAHKCALLEIIQLGETKVQDRVHHIALALNQAGAE